MQIGPLNIQIPILLAPMAGVTDYPFRVLCKAQGAGVVYSEFVSAHGIIRENAKTWQMIKFTDFERPIGIQIFGCLLYTSPSPRDLSTSRMPSSA